MNLLSYPLLTDENIDSDVVAWLRQAGADVRTVFDESLAGRTDLEIIRHALPRGRVILTHDSDFGTLAIRKGEPIFGVMYLRPGHRLSSFTIESLAAIRAEAIEAQPPFIAVVERRGVETRVRIRAPFAI